MLPPIDSHLHLTLWRLVLQALTVAIDTTSCLKRFCIPPLQTIEHGLRSAHEYNLQSRAHGDVLHGRSSWTKSQSLPPFLGLVRADCAFIITIVGETGIVATGFFVLAIATAVEVLRRLANGRPYCRLLKQDCLRFCGRSGAVPAWSLSHIGFCRCCCCCRSGRSVWHVLQRKTPPSHRSLQYPQRQTSLAHG